MDDISRDPALVHPWLQSPGRIPDGKLFHAYQMMFPADFYNPLGSEADPEMVTPLFLPAAAGAGDAFAGLAADPRRVGPRAGAPRLSARGAEADRYAPDQGRPGRACQGILVRNIGFARNLLLDGRLVREQLLDRDQLSAVLSAGPGRLRYGQLRAVRLPECSEAWVRQWTTA